jgi:hypothetical protein
MQLAAHTFWITRHLGFYLCRLSPRQFIWPAMEHVGCDKIRLPPTSAANAATWSTFASNWCKMNLSIRRFGRLGHYEW